MAKWKEIKEQRIQTFDKEIWLYDRANNVIVKVEVPRRPWTKLDPDFTHWNKVDKEFPEDAPHTNPDGSENAEHAAARLEEYEKIASTLRSTFIASSTATTVAAIGEADDEDDTGGTFAF